MIIPAFMAPIPPLEPPRRTPGSGKSFVSQQRDWGLYKIGTERLINGPGLKPWVKEVFWASVGMLALAIVIVWQHS